ncbi:hypothetical protein [Chryseobacterium sp. MMS23-Vi53]|uniref:hypothetical protein n=1 Tax=Chryseobacterium sp. MMS23-Vi53 TaxID=3386644 RepID=UPI0039EC743C
MKNYFIIGTLSISSFFFGQVGINTTAPKATLDIVAKEKTGSNPKPEGLIIPRIDREKAQSMTGVEVSTMVYIDNISTGIQNGIAANIDAIGYYHYDGNAWVKMTTQNNVNNIYRSNGILSGDRIINQGNNKLAFTGNSANAFSVDGSTFSVDASSNRIGIGTTSPFGKIDIVTDNPSSTNDNEIFMRSFGKGKVPIIYLSSANGTLASPTDLTNGDIIGKLSFTARVGGSYSWGKGSTILSTYKGNGTTESTDLKFQTSNTDRVIINEVGNVGIGTIAPKNRLDLGSDAPATATDVAGKKLAIYNNAAGDSFYGFGVHSFRLQFHSGSKKDSAPAMVLAGNQTDSTGMLGINTINPETRLDVVTVNNMYGIQHSNGTIKLRTYLGTGTSNGNTEAAWFGTQTNHPLDFMTNSSMRMRITIDGRVGVGTSAPDSAAILDLASTTKGFLPPRMTDAQMSQIAAPVPEGLMIYNSTTKKMQYYNGSAWIDF